MKLYVHKQEVWDDKKCARMAASAPKDAFGNRPPKGLINSSSSSRPSYGQTTRYNGGIVREGEWYEGEMVPLPLIPENWEFVKLVSWGTRIQKKSI